MPKHDDEFTRTAKIIETVRRPIARLPEKLPNFEPIDLALGALYASHDLAQRAGMSPVEAIEWLRTAADLMERQLLDGQASK